MSEGWQDLAILWLLINSLVGHLVPIVNDWRKKRAA